MPDTWLVPVTTRKLSRPRDSTVMGGVVPVFPVALSCNVIVGVSAELNSVNPSIVAVPVTKGCEPPAGIIRGVWFGDEVAVVVQFTV